MSVALIETAREFRDVCSEARREGVLALVPTMGFLHQGHQSLIRVGTQHAPAVAVTIFVNPTQFGPGEDLARYPRDLDGDLKKCGEAGAKFVFAPRSPLEIYPDGFQTHVDPGPLAGPLCGERRPGHFRGVCTVVAKLFALSRADCAFFGEKDFQQLAVIRRMALDLDLGTEVIGCPIVREPDGLAMSSRNAYLTAQERPRAVAISRALANVQRVFATGERSPAALEPVARKSFESADLKIDYVELRNPLDLFPAPLALATSRLFIAVFLGKTRLIDNAQLAP